MGDIVCSYVRTAVSYFISVISTNKQEFFAAVNNIYHVAY